MRNDIKFLRARAFIALVVILLISPFVLVWNAAPYVWDDLVETWNLHIWGSLIISWAIVRHGKNAKDHIA